LVCNSHFVGITVASSKSRSSNTEKKKIYIYIKFNKKKKGEKADANAARYNTDTIKDLFSVAALLHFLNLKQTRFIIIICYREKRKAQKVDSCKEQT